MGFYFRKSFKAGPIRFNLSKSGIGMSTGMKGLRIGTGPRGAYIAGGRKGLYFRQSLGSKELKRSPTSGVALRNGIVASVESAPPAPAHIAAPRAGGYGLAILVGLIGALYLMA